MQREVARVRDYYINQSHQWGYRLLACPRTNTAKDLSSPQTLRFLFGGSRSFLSLCFISHSIAISHATIALPRVLFMQLLSLFSPSVSLSLSLSVARAFSSGLKGRDPGATVSKYDTGIGYKETINHSSTREWDLHRKRVADAA